jgi:hypothetical protein
VEALLRGLPTVFLARGTFTIQGGIFEQWLLVEKQIV